ncbi:MAG: hypothetical protein R3B52_03495 [Candidatus Paceibacterota bacterium]
MTPLRCIANLYYVGYENVFVSFWYKIAEKLESGDHVYVQWSDDGSDFNVGSPLLDITNVVAGDWIFTGPIALPAKYRSTHLVLGDFFSQPDEHGLAPPTG